MVETWRGVACRVLRGNAERWLLINDVGEVLRLLVLMNVERPLASKSLLILLLLLLLSDVGVIRMLRCSLVLTGGEAAGVRGRRVRVLFGRVLR